LLFPKKSDRSTRTSRSLRPRPCFEVRGLALGSFSWDSLSGFVPPDEQGHAPRTILSRRHRVGPAYSRTSLGKWDSLVPDPRLFFIRLSLLFFPAPLLFFFEGYLWKFKLSAATLVPFFPLSIKSLTCPYVFSPSVSPLDFATQVI